MATLSKNTYCELVVSMFEENNSKKILAFWNQCYDFKIFSPKHLAQKI
jgi:hypothetical protein